MYWVITHDMEYRFEKYLASSRRCLGSTIFLDVNDLSKYEDQLALGIL